MIKHEVAFWILWSHAARESADEIDFHIDGTFAGTLYRYYEHGATWRVEMAPGHRYIGLHGMDTGERHVNKAKAAVRAAVRAAGGE